MGSSFYITSFKEAGELDIPVWSSAVYQPKWLEQRPKANWMDIRPDGGDWIRPREYLDDDEPLTGYFQDLHDLYYERKEQAIRWLFEVDRPVAIACWCPYDKAAQRQLKEFGTFVCHTAAVGHFLEAELDERVVYDYDRLLMERSEDYIGFYP